MSTKLSKKLERINTSVSKIRQKANMPDAVIEDLAIAVESMVTPEGSITITENSTVDVSNYAEAIVNVPNSGGSSSEGNGMYRVETIEQRNALEANEGDICIVYADEIFNYDGTRSGNTLYFPTTIVADTAITDYGYASLQYGSDMEEVMYDLSSTSLRIMDYGDYQTLASYTSTDGKTYTRTTSTEFWTAPGDFSTRYALEEIIIPFIFMKSVNYGGLFEYAEQDYYACETVGEQPRLINKGALSEAGFSNWGTVLFMYNCILGKNNEIVECDYIGMSVANNTQTNAKLQYNTTNDSIYIATQTGGAGISVCTEHFKKGVVSSPIYQSLNTTTLTKFATLNGYNINDCIVFSDQSSYSWDISGLTTLKNQSGTVLNPNFEWATSTKGLDWIGLDLGISINPENFLFYPKRAIYNDGVAVGKLGSEEADSQATINAVAVLNKSISTMKFTGALTDNFSALLYTDYKYNPPVLDKIIYLPEVDCSELTAIASSSYSRYNFTSNFDTQPYYKLGIVSCGGFKNLGAGFKDTTNAGVNYLHQGIMHLMDDESVVKVLKGLAQVSASKMAAVCLDRRIYDLIIEHNLFDEIRNKGWKIMVPSYSKYIELTSITPSTIAQARTFISGKNNERAWLAGLVFDESILTQTLSISTSNIFDTCCTDPLNKYLPIITIHLTNSSSSPYYNAEGTFYRCTALEKIGGISFTSAHSTKNVLNSAAEMYQDCHKLKEFPSIDLSTVTTISSMFENCFSMETIPNYNFAKVTTATALCYNCTSLTNVANLKLPVATNCNTLFRGCTSLVDIPSTFSLPAATSISSALTDCPSLSGTSIYNFLNGVNPANLTNKNLSTVGITLEQWNTLTSSQQEALISKGYVNNLE